jgi:hypothetical protein
MARVVRRSRPLGLEGGASIAFAILDAGIEVVTRTITRTIGCKSITMTENNSTLAKSGHLD